MAVVALALADRAVEARVEALAARTGAPGVVARGVRAGSPGRAPSPGRSRGCVESSAEQARDAAMASTRAPRERHGPRVDLERVAGRRAVGEDGGHFAARAVVSRAQSTRAPARYATERFGIQDNWTRAGRAGDGQLLQRVNSSILWTAAISVPPAPRGVLHRRRLVVRRHAMTSVFHRRSACGGLFKSTARAT